MLRFLILEEITLLSEALCSERTAISAQLNAGTFMNKLLIFLSALAITLTVLPIQAKAGERQHRCWRHHQSYHWKHYYRPYYWRSPYYGYYPYPYRDNCYRVHPGVISSFD